MRRRSKAHSSIDPASDPREDALGNNLWLKEETCQLFFNQHHGPTSVFRKCMIVSDHPGLVD